MTPERLIQPPEPIQPPSATPASATPWWVTTILGLLVPALGIGAQYVEEPWRGVLLSLAGTLAAALGLTHSGAVKLTPRPTS